MDVITVISGFNTIEANGLFSIVVTHKRRLQEAVNKRIFALWAQL